MRDIVMNPVKASAPQEKTVLKGCLGHFRQRFGHLNYADVERMAVDPNNGIELTDLVRKNCLTCPEGKKKQRLPSHVRIAGEMHQLM